MPLHLSSAQVDRACGALLGSAAGDALGAGYEFAHLPADLVPAMIGGGLGDFAPGEWTDDTSMTWAIADVAATGLDLRTPEALDAIAARFREWFDTRPPDIGINTSTVLRAAGASPTGASLTAAAQAEHDATGHTGGNGSLMRTAAVGLTHLDDPAALAEAAMAVSALTHADPRAQEACALWSLAIRHAVLEGEYDVRSGLALLPPAAAAFWSERLDEAEQSEPATFNPNGYVVLALQAAWSAIVHTPIPTDGEPCGQLVTALENAVKIGHDTDTVAAIAGALLGARWGMSAVPASWRRILHGYPGLTGLDLERLAYLTARGGRPGKYEWPLVDHIDCRDLQHGKPALVRHPHDAGVWLAGATALDDIPTDVDAVVSLCLTGRTQVPSRPEHINFRLMDESDPAANPHLDFVIADSAQTVQALRDEGKTVLLHCVAAHSRTPTIGIAYAMLLGVPLEQAMDEVCSALPAAHPNRGFRAALKRAARLEANRTGDAP